ncbi:MAG: TVP38/TMEM64 family protein [Synechococcaceae bacterium WB9_2_112]|nr:TVP38/TMEM64 family protein [Synechococcaceae bacterium WB9_2_112]
MAGLPPLDAVVEALASPLGAIAFVPLYALWVTLLLPGVWASMLAGALYGTAWGSVVVFVGACLGAEVVFLLGRSWLRDWARGQLQRAPRLQAIEGAVSREGLKLVLLTRLSPAFPFSLLNLAYGLSQVSLRDYTLGLIGILPGTVLFCALGALAGDVARFGAVLSGRADPATWALRVLGVVATVVVVALVGNAARQALAEPTGGGPAEPPQR